MFCLLKWHHQKNNNNQGGFYHNTWHHTVVIYHYVVKWMYINGIINGIVESLSCWNPLSMDTAIDLFFETFCIQPVSRNKSSPYFGPCIYPIPKQSFRELFIIIYSNLQEDRTTTQPRTPWLIIILSIQMAILNGLNPLF